jgi:hypothetical protein
MSSLLTHPDQVYYDVSKKLVKLFWNDKIEHKMAPPNGAEYYCRGGICFPTLTEQGGLGAPRDVLGFVVMVAMCMSTKHYYVIGEKEFQSIDHIIDPDTHGIAVEGVSGFFNKMWSTYYADSYYWSGHSETVMKYLLQVIRSEIVKPQPHFIEIATGVPGQQQQAVYELLQRGGIHWRKGGKVHESFQKYDARSIENIPCAVKAMMDCISGMTKHPYRRPQEEQ